MSIHSLSSLGSSLDSLADPHLAAGYASDNEKSESNRATKRARYTSYQASEKVGTLLSTSQVAQETLYAQGMGVFTSPSLKNPERGCSLSFMQADSKDTQGCFRGFTTLTSSFGDKALADSKPFIRSPDLAAASEPQEFSFKAVSDPFLDEPDELRDSFQGFSERKEYTSCFSTKGSPFELSSSPKELPADVKSSKKEELEPTVFDFLPSKSRKNILDTTTRSPAFVGARLSPEYQPAVEKPLQVFQKKLTPLKTPRLGLSLSDGSSSEGEDSGSEDFGSELKLEIDRGRALARKKAEESLVPKRSRSGDSLEVSVDDIECRLKSTVLSRVQERSDSRGASSRPEQMFASLRSQSASVPISFTSIAETEETEKRAASVPVGERKSSPFIPITRK
jgi:hypothetical protein